MAQDGEAARARAEASFRKAEPPSGGAEAERAQREKTARLREMRLAQQAIARRGAEIRSSRRRGA